ncbi:MAG: hypothetical protein NTAFB05_31900 [Nitrobacter sp.]
MARNGRCHAPPDKMQAHRARFFANKFLPHCLITLASLLRPWGQMRPQHSKGRSAYIDSDSGSRNSRRDESCQNHPGQKPSAKANRGDIMTDATKRTFSGALAHLFAHVMAVTSLLVIAACIFYVR